MLFHSSGPRATDTVLDGANDTQGGLPTTGQDGAPPPVSADPYAGVAPLCIFPEGITHAGNCVLPFFSGAFEGALCIPVLYIPSLRYHLLSLLSGGSLPSYISRPSLRYPRR